MRSERNSVSKEVSEAKKAKNEKKAKAIPQINREILNANVLFTILYNISIRKEEI